MTENPTQVPQHIVNEEASSHIDAVMTKHSARYPHLAYANWRMPEQKAAPDLQIIASDSGSHNITTVHKLADTLVRVTVEREQPAVTVLAVAPSRELAAAAILQAKRWLPPGDNPAPDVIPIAFWSNSPHGARSITRDIDAPPWEEIEHNYTNHALSGIEHMVSEDFKPGIGGQLLLWHGEPGTGKTTALRALAREWRKWCSLHYIVDPDRFFGGSSDYMMDVLLGGHYETLGDDDEKKKWRLLVLEDCGEMLQPDARAEVGQALSRFLNACDGLIGRGLRVMVLVTTNEALGKLHPAVARPGRCAMEVRFEPFSVAEAEEWLSEHGCEDASVTGPQTLADLYARTGDFANRPPSRVPVGF